MGDALMARIRTVKPDFWGSPKTAKVSRDARLLFLGLLNLADDEGRLLSSPKAIAGNVFPHDDDVFAKDVTEWMTELVGAGFVVLYAVDGIGYCAIVGFGEHQRVSHPTPSKFPPPPPETPSDQGGESFANPAGIAPELLVPEVEQGTGNREGEAPAFVERIHAVMAPGCSPSLIDEALEVCRSFADTYPPDDVESAVDELIAQRRRFPFASHLRTALANLLGPAPAGPNPHPLDEAQRAQREAMVDLAAQRPDWLEDDVPDPEARKAFLAEQRARRSA